MFSFFLLFIRFYEEKANESGSIDEQREGDM